METYKKRETTETETIYLTTEDIENILAAEFGRRNWDISIEFDSNEYLKGATITLTRVKEEEL